MIAPLSNRIFVKPDPPPDRSKGGIWFPEQTRKPLGMGVVRGVGPGMGTRDGGRWPMPDIKIGDRVLFDARAHFPQVRIDDEDVIVLRDDTVLAVLED